MIHLVHVIQNSRLSMDKTSVIYQYVKFDRNVNCFFLVATKKTEWISLCMSRERCRQEEWRNCSYYIYTFVVSRALMAGAASQTGDAASRAPGLTSGLQGSVNVHRDALLLVPHWQCISSFVFYTFILLECQRSAGKHFPQNHENVVHKKL